MDCCLDVDGLRVVRGDDWGLRFDVTYPDDTPADLSFYGLALFTMGSARLNPAVQVPAVIDATESCVWVTVPHTLTDVEPSVYRADLELTTLWGALVTPRLLDVLVVDDMTKHDDEGGDP